MTRQHFVKRYSIHPCIPARNLKSLKGKRLLILGAGEEQISAISLAKQIGLFVISADANPKAPGLTLADVGISIDIKDIPSIISIAKKYNIDGVMAHAVEIPVVIARVAQTLGLPSISPDVAENATNKFKRLECLRRANVPIPQYRCVESIEEAINTASGLGFPIVLKPTNNSAARGVIKVDSPDALPDAFNFTSKFSLENFVLIEKYIEGEELSTESLIVNGEIYTIGIADRNYDRQRFAPYFIENGGEMPTKINNELHQKVLKTIEAGIKAIGINWGVVKGDIIIDNDKPKILELAVRTSGGRFSSLKIPISTGVDFLGIYIRMCVGDDIDPIELKPKCNIGIAERFIFHKPIQIKIITGIDEAIKTPEVIELYLDKKLSPGNTLPPITNHTNRYGYVVTTAPTREQAVRTAEQAIEKIKIIY